jgi:hypothetical protein
MTTTYENGSGSASSNGNGMNARVWLMAVASVSLLFCWFAICGLTGTVSSRGPTVTCTFTYHGPMAENMTAKNPPR